jgi:hypothetical protein
MTASPVDLRRRPDRAAGNLYRVTAAMGVLSLPLFWAVYRVLPVSAPYDCHEHPCPPAVDSMPAPSALNLLVPTAVIELVVIAVYLVVAARRQTVEPLAGLRSLPASAAVVALACGGFSWLVDDVDLDFEDLGEAGLGYLLLLGLWLFTPLVTATVRRGDRWAAILVLIGLAPTAVCGIFILDKYPIGALPFVMIVASLPIALRTRRSP